MGKTSSSVKARWNGAHYDRIAVTVPRGRLADVKEYCSANGETVNGLVNRLLMDEIGMDEAAWKSKPTEPDSAASTDSTHPGGMQDKSAPPQEPPRVPEIMKRPL